MVDKDKLEKILSKYDFDEKTFYFLYRDSVSITMKKFLLEEKEKMLDYFRDTIFVGYKPSRIPYFADKIFPEVEGNI